MENPGRKTLRVMLFLLLGMAIGVIPGAIRIDELHRQMENISSANQANLQKIADLSRKLHDDQYYYMKQMAVYRHALGIRLVPAPESAKTDGMICNEEYVSAATATNGMVRGIRSWKPRADGRCYAEDSQ
jgi:hypothetical protein